MKKRTSHQGKNGHSGRQAFPAEARSWAPDQNEVLSLIMIPTGPAIPFNISAASFWPTAPNPSRP